MRINDVLINPIQTEKSAQLAQEGCYMFEVNCRANKFQIKEAIEELFKVEVEKVRITWRKGKVKKVGRRMRPKKNPDRKIAFVKLKEGHIDLFPRE